MTDNRCMFIEGIGRVHVIGPLAPEPPPPGKRRDSHGRFRSLSEFECGPAVALADAPPFFHDLHPQRTFDLTMRAANIVAGYAKGKILWSVRFQEKSEARP